MEDLSKKTGIARSTISRWESGLTPTIKIEMLGHVADVCDVNLLWLLGYDVPFEKRTKKEEELEKLIGDHICNLNEDQLAKVLKFIEEFL